MRNKKSLTFVTNNKEKIADIKEILDNVYEIKFVSELDLFEKQTLSVEQVVEYKAKQAYEILKTPVAVSDSGLEIIALKNFPGALVKYTNETIGQEGLIKLLENEKNRKAFFVAAIGYCDQNQMIKVFVERDEGTIALEPKGNGWHFDRIFIPLGEERTWAEIGRESKNLHSAFRRALKKLAAYLNK